METGCQDIVCVGYFARRRKGVGWWGACLGTDGRRRRHRRGEDVDGDAAVSVAAAMADSRENSIFDELYFQDKKIPNNLMSGFRKKTSVREV